MGDLSTFLDAIAKLPAAGGVGYRGLVGGGPAGDPAVQPSRAGRSARRGAGTPRSFVPGVSDTGFLLSSLDEPDGSPRQLLALPLSPMIDGP
ncbi:MAG: hypothetical protein KJ792_08880 [Actinobacteria bacterium]|nr:hypothetical protein [Actinomycetota bacterium]